MAGTFLLHEFGNVIYNSHAQTLMSLLIWCPNIVRKAEKLVLMEILRVTCYQILIPVAGHFFEQTGKYKDTYKSKLIPSKSMHLVDLECYFIYLFISLS